MVFLNKFLFFSLFQLSEKCFVGVSLQPTSLHVPIWFNLVFFSVFYQFQFWSSVEISSRFQVHLKRQFLGGGKAKDSEGHHVLATHSVKVWLIQWWLSKIIFFAIPRDLFQSFWSFLLQQNPTLIADQDENSVIT